MLIYVDKKKEKQKKIRIITFILCCTFIILLNIKHFYTSQDLSTQNLATYQTIKHTNPWYQQSAPVHLFSSKENSFQTVILIPDKLTRENAITLAAALSKLPNQLYSLNMTSDVPDKKTIQTIAQRMLNISDSNTATANILLTTDINNVLPIIYQEHLHPSTFTYKASQEALKNSLINVILNNIYPTSATAKNNIEKEQQNLEVFAKDNFKYIKKFIFKQKEPPFSKQNLFLKNIRLCLKSKNEISCSTATENSFLKNLSLAKKNLKGTPDKLILWTSNFPLDDLSSTELTANEGIYFKNGNRQSFLLPQDIKTLTNAKEILYILKRKVGLNPEYTNSDMKLYKFKTAEVNLDDNL